MIDRVALAQIWPRLRAEHQQVLAALAIHDDYGLAAQSLGISRSWFITRLGAARRAFLRLWHEGEPPSRPWANDWRGTRTTDLRVATSPMIAGRRRARSKATSPRPHRPGSSPPRADLGISDTELVRRYEAGQSIRQLGASLGASYSVVHNRLRAENAHIRPANGHQTRR